jgi:hypothetical protein
MVSVRFHIAIEMHEESSKKTGIIGASLIVCIT